MLMTDVAASAGADSFERLVVSLQVDKASINRLAVWAHERALVLDAATHWKAFQDFLECQTFGTQVCLLNQFCSLIKVVSKVVEGYF